jgi:translation initiation factor IF-3
LNTKNFKIIDADGETYGSFVRELEDAINEAKKANKD